MLEPLSAFRPWRHVLEGPISVRLSGQIIALAQAPVAILAGAIMLSLAFANSLRRPNRAVP